MSEDNICNYCKLREIRDEAKRQGKFVQVRQGAGSLGGVNVYVVPDATQHYYLQEEEDNYFKEWFMAIGDHCTC